MKMKTLKTSKQTRKRKYDKKLGGNNLLLIYNNYCMSKLLVYN